MKMSKKIVIVNDRNALNCTVSVFQEMKYVLIFVIVEIVKIICNIKISEKRRFKIHWTKIPLLLITKFLNQNRILVQQWKKDALVKNQIAWKSIVSVFKKTKFVLIYANVLVAIIIIFTNGILWIKVMLKDTIMILQIFFFRIIILDSLLE